MPVLQKNGCWRLAIAFPIRADTMAKHLLEQQESERLYFRKVQPSDFETWLPFYHDPESTQHWDGIPSDSIQACQEQFDRIFERYENLLGGMNALVLKESHVLIGLCGLLIQTVDGKEELEIGYSILPNYRQQGFAIEAAMACKKYAFDRQLAPSLISIIHINNRASQKVALKNGMQKTIQTNYKGNPVYIYRINVPQSL